MRAVVDWVQSLPLPAMFLVTFAIALAVALVILGVVRTALRPLGFYEGRPLVLKDAAVNTVSAMFALMMAFSAAGIWNDSLQARTAVQREANALENLRSLADSFPQDLSERIKADVRAYAKQVLDGDWPAMARKQDFMTPVYDRSEEILIALLETIAKELAARPGLAGAAPAIGQIVEARSARLQRISLATQGVTNAQWLAMILIASAALTALAMVHNHELMSQLLAVGIYAGAASAAFFVILAHDLPFVGRISVSAQPIAHLLAR